MACGIWGKLGMLLKRVSFRFRSKRNGNKNKNTVFCVFLFWDSARRTCPQKAKFVWDQIHKARPRTVSLVLVLRTRFVHLEILGFPMGDACQYKDNFARFKTIRRKQNLASTLGIQKEN